MWFDLVDGEPEKTDSQISDSGYRAEDQEEDHARVENVVEGKDGLSQHQNDVYRIRQRSVLNKIIYFN